MNKRSLVQIPVLDVQFSHRFVVKLYCCLRRSKINYKEDGDELLLRKQWVTNSNLQSEGQER